EAARARRLEPLDRVNGGLTDWPSGTGLYAYGAEFHEYLANRFGRESLARLAEATSSRVPYTTSCVFLDVFCRSLGDLRRAFDQIEIARNVGTYSDLYALSRSDGTVRRLTHGARLYDADLSPDGKTIVCVQDKTGQRDLVLVEVAMSPVVRLKPDTTNNAASG